MAESSNPFLIMRSMLKIAGKRNTQAYKINELVFVAIYLPVRMVITPLALIYMYEGDQVIYGTKFGVTFVLYIQLFWCYKVLHMAAGSLRDAVPKNQSIQAFYEFTDVLANNKLVLRVLSVTNFIIIFVIPHYYYGFARKTLFNW